MFERQYSYLQSLLILVFLCGTVTSAKDLDVLILCPEMDTPTSRVRTGFDLAKTVVYLNAMLEATPSFAGSSCTSHTETDVDSLLELHYDTRYRATTASVIASGDYDVVVMVDYYPYLRWAPELCFEGAMQLSAEILEAGARPVFLMTVGDGNGDSGVVGRNSYRVANGCGIEVNPAGYALLDQGLFVKSLGEQQAYVIAASLYSQITGLNAADLDYAPVVDHAVLAQAAHTNLQTQAHGNHYTASPRRNSNMVRYRTIDVSATPFNGVVRYAYVGTSTEAGINSYLQPIIQANGWTAAPQFIGSNGGGSKYWTETDFNTAQPYFDSYDDQFLFAYARGTTFSSRPMIAYDQANLIPMVFDRHRDNIGSGAGSSLEMLKDIEVGSWYDYYYHRGRQWNAVPFHVAATRLYHQDNSLIVSSDGVHLTPTFYNLVASMMLTSALGQDLQPSTAIQNNASHLAAFNMGKQVIKELSYLSENANFMPDSQLTITTERLPLATTTVAYAHSLEVSGGTAPYVWHDITASGLPDGLSVSNAGVLSGVPSTAGTYVLVFKVTDANGSIRKRAIKLLVQDAGNPSYSDWAEFMFDNSGYTIALQATDVDSEGDGLVNFMEYALGLDPNSVDLSTPFDWHGESDLSVRFNRAQSHLRYQVQFTTDVGDWNAANVVWDSAADTETLVAVGAEQEVELEFGDEAQCFYRLRVSE